MNILLLYMLLSNIAVAEIFVVVIIDVVCVGAEYLP
jgi:hypothetical protein